MERFHTPSPRARGENRRHNGHTEPHGRRSCHKNCTACEQQVCTFTPTINKRSKRIASDMKRRHVQRRLLELSESQSPAKEADQSQSSALDASFSSSVFPVPEAPPNTPADDPKPASRETENSDSAAQGGQAHGATENAARNEEEQQAEEEEGEGEEEEKEKEEEKEEEEEVEVDLEQQQQQQKQQQQRGENEQKDEEQRPGSFSPQTGHGINLPPTAARLPRRPSPRHNSSLPAPEKPEIVIPPEPASATLPPLMPQRSQGVMPKTVDPTHSMTNLSDSNELPGDSQWMSSGSADEATFAKIAAAAGIAPQHSRPPSRAMGRPSSDGGKQPATLFQPPTQATALPPLNDGAAASPDRSGPSKVEMHDASPAYSTDLSRPMSESKHVGGVQAQIGEPVPDTWARLPPLKNGTDANDAPCPYSYEHVQTSENAPVQPSGPLFTPPTENSTHNAMEAAAAQAAAVAQMLEEQRRCVEMRVRAEMEEKSKIEAQEQQARHHALELHLAESREAAQRTAEAARLREEQLKAQLEIISKYHEEISKKGAGQGHKEDRKEHEQGQAKSAESMGVDVEEHKENVARAQFEGEDAKVSQGHRQRQEPPVPLETLWAWAAAYAVALVLGWSSA